LNGSKVNIDAVVPSIMLRYVLCVMSLARFGDVKDGKHRILLRRIWRRMFVLRIL